MLRKGRLILCTKHAQLKNTGASTSPADDSELVGDKALELSQPLFATHQISNQPATNVLPKQLRIGLEADKAEYASEYIVGCAACGFCEVALEARQKMSLP